MKKTINVNLNGRVFTIDEDAYRLLDIYLNNLRLHFQKEEGAMEIIADFEARIEELFSDKIRLGHQVITFEHVEEVIARVGKPADFADRDEMQEDQARSFELSKGKKKLYRNMDDKMIGGVCSGIATYFGWNVTAIRIILVVLLISPFILSSLKFSGFHNQMYSLFVIPNFGFWICLAYLIMCAVVPAANTVEKKLQMEGKPVTVENIGKTVAAQSAPVASNAASGCLDVFVAFLKVCLVALGCIVGLPLLFALFIALVVLIAMVFGVGGGLMTAGSGLLSFLPSFEIVKHPILLAIVVILVLAIPVFAIIHSLLVYFAKAKPLHQAYKWTLFIIWLLSFIIFLFSGYRYFSIGEHRLFHHEPVTMTYSIHGDGIQSRKVIQFDTQFTGLITGNNMNAPVQIEQTWDEQTSSIRLVGDQNLVEQVNYKIYDDGRLLLYSDTMLFIQDNLKITLRIRNLQSIDIGMIGKVLINRALSGNELEVKVRGLGNFRADSLNLQSLIVKTEGTGQVNLAGKTGKANFEASGTVMMDAMELLSDTVYASVSGVGSIHCNPVKYLEGSVSGVGSIIYKEEPQKKSVHSSGVGKIKKK